MTEAIIFDKDGTLIDFDAFWVTVSINAINYLLKKLNREDIPLEELLAAIGVENGVSDIDGILCKGTYEQMAAAINEVLKKYGCVIAGDEMVQMVLDAYNRNADSGEIKPTCENIKEVLTRLKEKGIKLLVVTTDNYKITQKCLRELGIEELFDRIYTDDGKTPVKPDPHCVLDFSESTGIEKDKIIMVGDTMTDIRFARNAGIFVVGVGTTAKNRQHLAEYADAVIENVSYIFDFIKGDK